MAKLNFKWLPLLALLLLPVGGCGSSTTEPTAATINVISREDGSGTRGAFVELVGIQDKNKVDHTTPTAEITNNTAVMMTTIANNKNAIGYISLGSLNNTVTALKIDGVAATVETVKSKQYPIVRPFIIATKGTPNPAAQDFIAFIMSKSGQDLVEVKGYIGVTTNHSYQTTAPTGKLTIAGSSSVTPIMERLIEAYQTVNPHVTIDIQQSDSSTGINNVIENICDIGMASRELKSSELNHGLTKTVIALDGIAVIVNNQAPVTALTKEQVKAVFTGEIKTWAALK